MKAVTYGPFPPDKAFPVAADFTKIRQAGFDSIRLFTLPGPQLLDQAERAGLVVFAGLDWDQHGDFLAEPSKLSAAHVRLSEWLMAHGRHPVLAGIYVGNEIPCDLVRWMDPAAVLGAIEGLIELGHGIAPHLLFAYANYPSTEYLEPGNADFSAFNIYLEDRGNFAAYLSRLQNIAGDRPLVVSEFGMDSSRNSMAAQAETLRRALDVRLPNGSPLFDAVQATWNLLEPSAGPALAEAKAEGLGVIVKEAVANGRLTPRNTSPDIAPLRAAADELGVTVDALAIAAVLAQPWVDIVLSGVAAVAHLQANVQALAIKWGGEWDGRFHTLVESPAQYWQTRSSLPWN